MRDMDGLERHVLRLVTSHGRSSEAVLIAASDIVKKALVGGPFARWQVIYRLGGLCSMFVSVQCIITRIAVLSEGNPVVDAHERYADTARVPVPSMWTDTGHV